jgi:ubiquitin C-terminal hydrolase
LLLNVGHYYSYVRIKGIWYKFDDNKPVEKESPEYNSKYVVGLYYIKENLI